jgi:putative transposase
MNQIWSMDFVADALFDGRRLRALTVVDNYTRESLAIAVGQNLKGEDVVNTLNCIAMKRGLAQYYQSRQWERIHLQGHG